MVNTASRGAWTVALALGAAACGTEYAQTAAVPLPEGGSGGAGASGGGGGTGATGGRDTECPVSLADRLSVTTFTTEADVRYKRRGYDWFPTDERLALAVAPAGDLHVAWLENEGTNVRVTPLDPDTTRRGADVVLPGFEVGGLVAREDGFMLLARRVDPGEPLRAPADGDRIAPAAVLVRVKDGVESFAAALTGTSGSVAASEGRSRDCAPASLNGRLAFNGEKYGAYFQVHGCEGHPNAPYYGDKLVYADDSGAGLAGGWEWKCSINQGSRLLAEPESFTTLCLSDGSPAPGLNLLAEEESVQLAPEMTTGGYCAGQFGSVVALEGGGYVVGWLSRGVRQSGGMREAAKQATDIAILRLDENHVPAGPVTWVLETPDIAEANLHLAPYGRHILVVWDSITDLECRTTTCFGTYAGTHARLIDPAGAFLTPDAVLPAPPATHDDLVVLPNGDLAWAFVPDPERDYADQLPLDADGAPAVPARREIAVARLRYCE